ncbi:hypothetical protein V5O48_015195 [Marasmius crinis-equi]|uniref:Uncharacterized protein n=1 Tax=Marasmius crinis-equi TaxID=585013 RepID=A0ABR3EVH8_9AGAR
MNPDDQSKVFEPVGTDIIINFVYVIAETGLWAIYLILFGWALHLQISAQKLKNITNVAIVLVTIVLFSTSTVLWAFGIAKVLIMLRYFFLDYPTDPVAERYMLLFDSVTRFGLPSEALFLFNMILGDAVVIWRAWVLTRATRVHKFVFVPIVMLMGSFAFSVIALQCLSSDNVITQSSIPDGSRICQWSEAIAWGMSLVTNVTSTILMGIRAWQYRSFLRSNGSNNASSSRSQKIMIILVESGFIYCLFWIQLFFRTDAEYNAVNFVQMFLNAVGDQVSGLYPTIIIILVSMERSLSNVSYVEAPMRTSFHPDVCAHTGEVSTIAFGSANGVHSSIGPSSNQVLTAIVDPEKQ